MLSDKNRSNLWDIVHSYMFSFELTIPLDNNKFDTEYIFQKEQVGKRLGN